MGVMEDERPFLIPLRRRWLLLVGPILAILYFIVLIAVVSTGTVVRGVSTDTLVLIGMVLFILVILAEVPFLLRRKASAPAPPPDLQDEPPEPEAADAAEDERLVTPEVQHGLVVLEYSAPAKSRTTGALYAKTYVPVSKEHVLRLETLTARADEL